MAFFKNYSFRQKIVLGLAGFFLFIACGSETGDQLAANTQLLTDEKIAETFIEPLSLSAVEGLVRIEEDTFFKISSAQSSTLSQNQKCFLKKGTELSYISVGSISASHRQINLDKEITGCPFKSGFLYVGHVVILEQQIFYAETIISTRFKKEPIDSSRLNSSDWCSLEAGKRYRLESPPEIARDGHARVIIANGELSNCSFKRGFIFMKDFKQVIDTPQTSDFARVMRHILVWEGGCSDHPNDPGGRTYKGITTRVARANGWQQDVCTMPDTLIYEIYRKDYWVNRAIRYLWPLNLAVMNTEVNSGGARAQEFLTRMAQQNIKGTLQFQASWYVDQQTAYYRLIASRNANLRVFLRGWLNRSAYMQDVIAGRRNLASETATTFTATAINPISSE